MTALESLMKGVESQWFQLPEEVRAGYGKKYFEKFQVNMKLASDYFVFIYLFLKRFKSERPNPLYGPSPFV